MKGCFKVLLIIFIAVSVFANDDISLEADRVISSDGDIYEADGNVIIFYYDLLMTADSMIYNKSSNVVRAEGNVILSDNDNYLNADKVEINLMDRTGTIINGKGFYSPNNFINAQSLKKVGESSFILSGASISTCSGSQPDWSFYADEANIDYGEYFKAKHVIGKIRNIPVLYLPYLIWPIKDKRKSGFLIPSAGFNSTKGFFITPKYFYNLDVDKDLTLGINFFDKKGMQYMSEFRYAKSSNENIYLAGDYIKEDYTNANKNDRWKIVNKSNFYLLDNFELRFNTNYVSDFRYRRDYDDYSIYDLEEYSDNKYINEIRLNYYSDIADISVRYRDDMHYYDLENGFMKLHLIRQPNLIIEKNYLDTGLFFIDYKFDYNKEKVTRLLYNIDDEDENSVTEKLERYNSYISLYKPFDFKIATFTPSFTQYYTRWFHSGSGFAVEETYENDLLNIDKFSDKLERYIYNFNLKLSFNDIYKQYDSFSHHIYNTFEYTQTPYLRQDNILRYIEDDVIDEENVYKYIFSNYFKANKWDLKLEFIQGYDVEKNNNRFLPIHEKALFNYKKVLSYTLESKYDYKSNDFVYMGNRLDLKFDYFYLRAEHIYDKEILELAKDYTGSRDVTSFPRDYFFDNDIIGEENASLKATVGFNIKNINLEFSREASGKHDNFGQKVFTELDTDEYEVRASYLSECWELGIVYKKKRYDTISFDELEHKDEHTIFFIIKITGFGGLERELS